MTAKLNRLKTIISKSFTKDIKVLIKNELLRNKYTLGDKQSNKIQRNKINMLKEDRSSQRR